MGVRKNWRSSFYWGEWGGAAHIACTAQRKGVVKISWLILALLSMHLMSQNHHLDYGDRAPGVRARATNQSEPCGAGGLVRRERAWKRELLSSFQLDPTVGSNWVRFAAMAGGGEGEEINSRFQEEQDPPARSLCHRPRRASSPRTRTRRHRVGEKGETPSNASHEDKGRVFNAVLERSCQGSRESIAETA